MGERSLLAMFIDNNERLLEITAADIEVSGPTNGLIAVEMDLSEIPEPDDAHNVKFAQTAQCIEIMILFGSERIRLRPDPGQGVALQIEHGELATGHEMIIGLVFRHDMIETVAQLVG